MGGCVPLLPSLAHHSENGERQRQPSPYELRAWRILASHDLLDRDEQATIDRLFPGEFEGILHVRHRPGPPTTLYYTRNTHYEGP